MRVTRADWAGSVPWAGISGKPSGVEDVSELSDEITSLKSEIADIKAILADINTEQVTLHTFEFDWSIGNLEPLQSISELFALNGIEPTTPMVVMSQADNLWLTLYAACFEKGSFRVVAVNSGPYIIAPGNAHLILTYFTNA